jgi:uncharacterized SAM-binding protein YcdF (DUF218 family)
MMHESATGSAVPGKRAGEDADGAGNRVGASGREPGKHRFLGSRRRKFLAIVAVLVVVFAAATVRLFVRPDQGMPPRVSAIVMLNGPGDRLDAALRLAWQHRAPFVVISRGSPAFGHGSDCAPQIPREKIICFDPNPSTTKGEAEFIGRLARQYRWNSLVLVTSTPQDSRARLRMERCFAGPVYVVTVSPSLSSWPYEIAYEWAATVKAVVFQRAC